MGKYYFAGSSAVVHRLNNVGADGHPPLQKQFLFFVTRHLLDGAFSFHRGLSIRLFLYIYQPHRQAHTGVSGTASLIVNRDAMFGVDGPACVIRPVGALHDVTIARHYLLRLPERSPNLPRNIWFIRSPKDSTLPSVGSFFSLLLQSARIRSCIHCSRAFRAPSRNS